MFGAGDGKPAFVSELVRYGRQLGLEGRFRLTPLVDDMPAALMVADVVVMPSITPEPFGRVALEAQAMGRPVVAFDHGCLLYTSPSPRDATLSRMPSSA